VAANGFSQFLAHTPPGRDLVAQVAAVGEVLVLSQSAGDGETGIHSARSRVRTMIDRKLSRLSRYRHYRPKSLGVVRIDGKDNRLGRYSSPKSRVANRRLLAEWPAKGRIDRGVRAPHSRSAGSSGREGEATG